VTAESYKGKKKTKMENIEEKANARGLPYF
jgi:hypothetical protein